MPNYVKSIPIEIWPS